MTRILYARGFHVSAFRDRYPRNSLPSQLNLSLSKTDDEAQSHEMDSNSRPPSYRSRREREDNIESRAAESTHNATMRNASTNTEPTVSTGTSDALAGRTAAPATQTPNKEDVDLNVAEYILGVAFILAMAELRDNGTIDLDKRRWGMLYFQWLWFLDIVAPFISAAAAVVVYIGLEASKK
ncbi:hypothetical protein PV05_00399 [Exophiala xenobiotica]|uniref:Uncharacterized protein n=1 Tax=Exophiala xenobiotica TaxID=348802 RepID=A0A0D2EZQ3_9EURO|nr:uncharacterized protein PV05_00399 [Exophiala xenobiotica]KIW60160.1 hypothetical protein PV05_00399 [Exophiala xenobiotica]